MSKIIETTPSKKRIVCFMKSSIINYKVLAKIHPDFGEECYIYKKVQKDIFIKHIYSLIS
jgi:hypothetical protein